MVDLIFLSFGNLHVIMNFKYRTKLSNLIRFGLWVIIIKKNVANHVTAFVKCKNFTISPLCVVTWQSMKSNVPTDH